MARGQIKRTGLESRITYSGRHCPTIGLSAPTALHHQRLPGGARVRNPCVRRSARILATMCRYCSRSPGRHSCLDGCPNCAKPERPLSDRADTAEQVRLDEVREKGVPWKQWGPYLSERQWGTVREDYSESGDAWNYFTHDQARSRTYHWGE